MEQAGIDEGNTRRLELPVALLFLLLCALIIKSAWIGDDAYILFRSVDNFVHGYGLRWNIDERVQVFTPPFWTLVIAAVYAITHEIFITVMLLGVALSAAGVFVLLRYGSSSTMAAVAGGAALISSKAFIDYTTAGLENSLGYLLIALFCIVLLRQGHNRTSFRFLILLYGLVGFNRLDHLLMLFPAVAFTAWTVFRTRGATLRQLAADAFLFSAPLWGWLVFATVYFGYALPNTYYAKIYTGIPSMEYVKQGLLYYVNSLNNDAVTLIVILLGIGFTWLSGNAFLKAGAVGLLLYLLYVVKIGGDFMSGRFFSVPFFFAVALLLQTRLKREVWAGFAVLVVVCGLTAKYPTIFYNEEYRGVIENNDAASRTSDVTDRRGIADERGWYFRDAGLLTVVSRYQTTPRNAWALEGRDARRRGLDFVEFGTPGLYGFYAGPDVHIVDTYALGDPLLSRLPIFDKNYWKIGHYGRAIPAGYIESLRSGGNEVVDPKVHELYRVTKILTQDPLWSLERFKEIFLANVGYYNSTIRAAPRVGVAPPLRVGERIELPNRKRQTGDTYKLGTLLYCNSATDWQRYARSGWSQPEREYTWTDGAVASIVIPVTRSTEPLKLNLKGGGMVHPPNLPSQTVDVVVNGTKVERWEVAEDRVYSAVIPPSLLTGERTNLQIDFSIPNATSPAQAGTGPDGRRLGLRVTYLSLSSNGGS